MISRSTGHKALLEWLTLMFRLADGKLVNDICRMVGRSTGHIALLERLALIFLPPVSAIAYPDCFVRYFPIVCGGGVVRADA